MTTTPLAVSILIAALLTSCRARHLLVPIAAARTSRPSRNVGMIHTPRFRPGPDLCAATQRLTAVDLAAANSHLEIGRFTVKTPRRTPRVNSLRRNDLSRIRLAFVQGSNWTVKKPRVRGITSARQIAQGFSPNGVPRRAGVNMAPGSAPSTQRSYAKMAPIHARTPPPSQHRRRSKSFRKMVY